MKKRLLSLLLCVIMLFTLLPVEQFAYAEPAQQEQGEEGPGEDGGADSGMPGEGEDGEPVGAGAPDGPSAEEEEAGEAETPSSVESVDSFPPEGEAQGNDEPGEEPGEEPPVGAGVPDSPSDNDEPAADEPEDPSAVTLNDGSVLLYGRVPEGARFKVEGRPWISKESFDAANADALEAGASTFTLSCKGELGLYVGETAVQPDGKVKLFFTGVTLGVGDSAVILQDLGAAPETAEGEEPTPLDDDVELRDGKLVRVYSVENGNLKVSHGWPYIIVKELPVSVKVIVTYAARPVENEEPAEEPGVPDGPTDEQQPEEPVGAGVPDGPAEPAQAEETPALKPLSTSGAGYSVTVSYTAEAGIPEGAQLKVSELAEGSAGYAQYAERSADATGFELEDLNYIKLLDIKIVDAQGSKVVLSAPVDVQIRLTDIVYGGGSTRIIHFTGSGTEVLAPAVSGNDLSFETSGFSIYAVTTTPMVHTVEFYVGSTLHQRTILREGEALTRPENPEVSGQYFLGWYTSAALTTPFTNFGATYTADNGTTKVYAKMATDVWTITYYDHSGNIIQIDTIEQGQDYTVYLDSPVYAKEPGKVGVAWKDKSTGTQYTAEQTTITPTADIEFEPVEELRYWVNFESNGGTQIETAYLRPNFDSLPKPTDPTHQGYTFAGWYKDAALTQQVFTDSESAELSAATVRSLVGTGVTATLYAKWTPLESISYTVAVWFENANFASEENHWGVALSFSKTGKSGDPVSLTAAEVAEIEQSEKLKSKQGYELYVWDEAKNVLTESGGVWVDNPGCADPVPTISGDGTTVLNVYYRLKTFYIRLVDYVDWNYLATDPSLVQNMSQAFTRDELIAMGAWNNGNTSEGLAEGQDLVGLDPGAGPLYGPYRYGQFWESEFAARYPNTYARILIWRGKYTWYRNTTGSVLSQAMFTGSNSISYDYAYTRRPDLGEIADGSTVVFRRTDSLRGGEVYRFHFIQTVDSAYSRQIPSNTAYSAWNDMADSEFVYSKHDYFITSSENGLTLSVPQALFRVTDLSNGTYEHPTSATTFTFSGNIGTNALGQSYTFYTNGVGRDEIPGFTLVPDLTRNIPRRADGTSLGDTDIIGSNDAGWYPILWFYARDYYNFTIDEKGANKLPASVSHFEIPYEGEISHYTQAYQTITSTYVIDSTTKEIDGVTYVFKGWYDNAFYEGDPVDLATYKMPLGGVTLTAKWEPLSVSVTFDPGTGAFPSSMASELTPAGLLIVEVNVGGQVAAPTSPTPASSEDVFLNWVVMGSDGRARPYNFAANVTHDITLYATYTGGTLYTIKYDRGASTSGPAAPTDSNHYRTGSTVQLLSGGGLMSGSDPFVGWQDGTGNIWYPGQVFTLDDTMRALANSSHEITLTAVYGKSPVYTSLTYNYNYPAGNLSPQPNDSTESHILNNDLVAVWSAPGYHPTGYHFAGTWNTAANGSGDSYTAGGSQIRVSADGDNTLYAQWAPNHYTVVFNGNGATSGGSYTTQDFVYDVAQQLDPNPFGRAYTVTYNVNGKGSVSPGSDTATAAFDGWATAANSPKLYDDQQTVINLTANDNFTFHLFAKWTLGSVTLPTPTAPAGYEFCGWYSDAACSTFVGYAGDPYTPSANITLYAQWSVLPYMISYELNHGSFSDPSQSSTQAYTVESTDTLVPAERDGYTFLGWKVVDTDPVSNWDLDSTHFATETVNGKYGNVTLEAQWSPIANTVTVKVEVLGAYADVTRPFTGTPTVTLYTDGTVTPTVEAYALKKGESVSYSVAAGESFRLTDVEQPEEYTLTATIKRGDAAAETLAISDAGLSELIALSQAADESIVITLTYAHKSVPNTGVDAGQSTPVMLMITVALLSAALILALPKRLRRREDEA